MPDLHALVLGCLLSQQQPDLPPPPPSCVRLTAAECAAWAEAWAERPWWETRIDCSPNKPTTGEMP